MFNLQGSTADQMVAVLLHQWLYSGHPQWSRIVDEDIEPSWPENCSCWLISRRCHPKSVDPWENRQKGHWRGSIEGFHVQTLDWEGMWSLSITKTSQKICHQVFRLGRHSIHSRRSLATTNYSKSRQSRAHHLDEETSIKSDQCDQSFSIVTVD